MFYLKDNTLSIGKTNLSQLDKGNIDFINSFNNELNKFPDKVLHSFSKDFFPKFNEIISKSLINYKKLDSRIIEILFFEWVNWWSDKILEKKIKFIYLENNYLCPIVYCIFVASKYHNVSFKLEFKFDSRNKIVKSFNNYKIVNEKIYIRNNLINKLYINFYNLYLQFQLKSLKFNNSKKKSIRLEISLKEYLNLLFNKDEFISLSQYIEINKDKFNNPRYKIVLNKELILLKNNYVPIINLKQIRYLNKFLKIEFLIK